MNRQAVNHEDPVVEHYFGTEAEAEWQRLRRQVDLSSGFWLAFLFSRSPRATRIFAARLAAVYRGRARRLRTLRAETPEELGNLLGKLFSPEVRCADAVWVTAIRDPASDRSAAWTQAWQTFFLRLNEHRNRLRRELEGALIIDVPPELKSDLRNAAPDLWSIRSVVLEPMESVAKPGSDSQAIGKGKEPDRQSPSDRDAAAVVAAGTRERSEPLSGTLDKSVMARLREVRGLLALDQPSEAVHEAAQAVALLLENTERHPLLIDAFAALAQAEAADGDNSAALDHYLRAVQVAGDDDHPALLHWLDAAAEAARNVGDHGRAYELIQRSELIARRRLERYGESPQALRDVSVSLDRVGDVRRESGDLKGAEAAYAESLEIRRRLLDQYGESPGRLKDLESGIRQMRDLHRMLGNQTEAELLESEMESLTRRLQKVGIDL